MTVISILNGDFEILFEDETVSPNTGTGMKMVRRTATASATKYTTNALYSAVADAADDFQAMGFENPMLPVTLNAYTMENDYFIPRSSTEWLEEGAIEADWNLNIRSFIYTVTTTDFVTDDIGRAITDGTNTGTLLDFEVLPDGTLLAWVRPEVPATDTWQLTTTVTVTGGTGSVTQSAVSTTGTSLYSSIQAIGAVPTATEVYLIQERQKMTDYQGNFQWWETDPNVSLGIIDILIRVKRDSIEIADGDVEIFARRYTSLYDQFRLNVAAGGRSALPLASAPDINNTTGYRVMTPTGVTGTYTVGNIVYDAIGSPASIDNATIKGVITAVDSTAPASPIVEYYLVGDLTDFTGGEIVQEYSTSLSANDDAVSTGNGTIGSNTGGPTDAGAGQGGTVTTTLGHILFDHDGVGGVEPYSVTVDAQNLVTAAKVYERIKYITRRGATTTDLFGAGVNIPGETYRGLEIQAQYTGGSPSQFTEGDDITGPGGYTSRLLSNNIGDTYVMMTDQQTSLDSVTNGDTITDETANIVIIDGTPVTIVSPKSSPFGTFTGSVIFGAQGVLYINPHTSDTQNYILTDDNGTQRTPPNTVAFVVNNTLALDRILVARDTGTAGIIDKDQFGGLAGTDVVGSSTVTVSVTGIDTEVATAGFIRIVETTLQEEHHYEYDSYVSGVSGTFALRDVDTAANVVDIHAAGVPTNGIAILEDDTADFVGGGAEVGMLVRNTTATKLHHVWEIVEIGAGSPIDATKLTVRQLYGPLDATQDWDVSDTYTINTLIGDHADPTPNDYAVGDNIFDLYIDEEATTTSVSNTFVKILDAPYNVVVNVRQGKIILPFTQNPSVANAGGSVTVVRAPDTIAT